jgi:threonine 3-dehydrogenase
LFLLFHCFFFASQNLFSFIIGNFHYLDVVNKYAFEKLVVEHKIDWLIHLTSLLSASGEKNPELAIEVNVGGILF